MNKILITICARGGSKGIPGKNIKEINDKPLIYYTLKVAEQFLKFHPSTYIYLSTDSEEVKTVVNNLKFDCINTGYTRPLELATDSVGKMEVIKDVKDYAEREQKVKFNFVIDLDVTSPLRSIKDIELAVKKLNSNPEALNIFSVNPASRNPYFNMVEENDQGFAELCKSGAFLTRQSSPPVYDMNASIYVYKQEFFKENRRAVSERSLIYKMDHICFDLDHPVDFEFITFLIKNDKLTFDFIQ